MPEHLLRFERPEALYLLLLIPLTVIFFIVADHMRKRSLQRYAVPQLLAVLMPLHSTGRIKIKFLLIQLALIFLIIAIANPQTGTKLDKVKREGIDIFIALDVSNSMLAEDILPNRLARAKQSISQLVDKLSGDRIGIIVFAGKAYVQLPLTTDYAAAKLFLSTINTNMVPAQGTAIGEAIQLATDAFDVPERNKAIIVISDGEDHEENAIVATRQASSQGIKVYTIGMGLADGAPIPIYNQYGKQTGFKKDRNNITVITKLNENLLKQISTEGKGVYVRAGVSRTGLNAIFEKIDKTSKAEIETKVFTDYESKFYYFVALAIFFLLAEEIISNRKKRWETQINLFDHKK